MAVLLSLRNGFQKAVSMFQLPVLLYVLNMVFALVPAFLFYQAVSRRIGSSLVLERMLHDFDYSVYRDFLNEAKSEFFVLYGVVLAVLLMYMLFSVFVDGGIIALFRDSHDTLSMRKFFGDCGEFAVRFLHLFFLWCGITVVLVVIALSFLTAEFGSWTTGALSETDLIFPAITCAGVFFFLLILLVMVLSYAKIIIVVEGEKKVRTALWRAVRFLVKNFFSATALQFILISAVAGLMILYLFIESSAGMTSGYSVVIVWVLQQTVVLLRMWLRMAGYGSQLSFYQAGKYTLGELTELEDIVTATEVSV
jgi:hypothetical protein